MLKAFQWLLALQVSISIVHYGKADLKDTIFIVPDSFVFEGEGGLPGITVNRINGEHFEFSAGFEPQYSKGIAMAINQNMDQLNTLLLHRLGVTVTHVDMNSFLHEGQPTFGVKSAKFYYSNRKIFLTVQFDKSLSKEHMSHFLNFSSVYGTATVKLECPLEWNFEFCNATLKIPIRNSYQNNDSLNSQNKDDFDKLFKFLSNIRFGSQGSAMWPSPDLLSSELNQNKEIKNVIARYARWNPFEDVSLRFYRALRLSAQTAFASDPLLEIPYAFYFTGEPIDGLAPKKSVAQPNSDLYKNIGVFLNIFRFYCVGTGPNPFVKRMQGDRDISACTWQELGDRSFDAFKFPFIQAMSMAVNGITNPSASFADIFYGTINYFHNVEGTIHDTSFDDVENTLQFRVFYKVLFSSIPGKNEDPFYSTYGQRFFLGSALFKIKEDDIEIHVEPKTFQSFVNEGFKRFPSLLKKDEKEGDWNAVDWDKHNGLQMHMLSQGAKAVFKSHHVHVSSFFKKGFGFEKPTDITTNLQGNFHIFSGPHAIKSGSFLKKVINIKSAHELSHEEKVLVLFHHIWPL